MRCFPLLGGQHHDRAVFRQTCDVYSALVVAGLDPAIHLFAKSARAKMDGYPGQAACDDLNLPFPQTSWSIRVPCPGGSGARTTGWCAPASAASASGFTSGALGSLASGIVTGGEAVTADTLIGTILLLFVTVTRRRPMLYESEWSIARHPGQSGHMVNGKSPISLKYLDFG
jgi:hypothetical protein